MSFFSVRQFGKWLVIGAVASTIATPAYSSATIWRPVAKAATPVVASAESMPGFRPGNPVTQLPSESVAAPSLAMPAFQPFPMPAPMPVAPFPAMPHMAYQLPPPMPYHMPVMPPPLPPVYPGYAPMPMPMPMFGPWGMPPSAHQPLVRTAALPPTRHQLPVFARQYGWKPAVDHTIVREPEKVAVEPVPAPQPLYGQRYRPVPAAMPVAPVVSMAAPPMPMPYMMPIPAPGYQWRPVSESEQNAISANAISVNDEMDLARLPHLSANFHQEEPYRPKRGYQSDSSFSSRPENTNWWAVDDKTWWSSCTKCAG